MAGRRGSSRLCVVEMTRRVRMDRLNQSAVTVARRPSRVVRPSLALDLAVELVRVVVSDLDQHIIRIAGGGGRGGGVELASAQSYDW